MVELLRLNQAVFREQSNERDYWIGFLMADGCVTDRNYITLSLKKDDINHLYFFRSFLKSPNSVGVSVNNYGREFAYLSVYSKQIVEDLAEFGVVPRKSKTAKIKGLEHNSHFWRGVIDGDGSIYTKKCFYKDRTYHAPALNLTGSKLLVNQFADYCEMITASRPTVHQHKRGSFYTQLQGKKALMLLEELYPRECISLSRKFKRAWEAMSDRISK